MQSIIEDLWYGKICPLDSGIFSNPQLKELLGYTARHRTELENALTEKQNELLEKMMECRNEYDSIAQIEIFTCGFRLGAKMILDVIFETKNE